MNEATEVVKHPPTQLTTRLRTWIEANRKEIVRFAKFSVVGVFGAVVDFGVLNLLDRLNWLEPVHLQLPFNAELTEVGTAGAISFGMAITSNFIWNRYWTYPDSRSKGVLGQLVMFFAINAAGLLIRVPVLEVLHKPLANLAASLLDARPDLTANLLSTWPDLAETTGKNLALAIAIVIVMFWNFFVNRYLTYSDVE
jgi:putative flippase GtrA